MGKDDARAAEKDRKQLQKGGSVTPSPAPEKKEDKAEAAFDSKHSAEWNAKKAAEKETSSSATSSKKEVKEASSSANEDGIQDDGSTRQVHTWEWRHRNEPCKGKPCKDSEKQESDH